MKRRLAGFLGAVLLGTTACDSPGEPDTYACQPPELQAPLERNETADGELFVMVPDPVLTDEQAQLATRIRGRKGMTALRFGYLTDSARSLLEEGRVIGVRLSDSARTIVRVQYARDSSCSLSNPCDPPRRYAAGPVVAEHPASHFSLSMAERTLVGGVTRGGWVYSFEPLGDRLMAIAEGIGCEMWKGMID